MSRLTYDEAAEQLRRLTEKIREREKDYANAVERAADAEAVYRAALADAIKRHRIEGKAVSEADTLARGECALLSRERDAAAGMVKHAAAVLENRRDDRRSFNRLIDWAATHDRPHDAHEELAGDGSYGGSR